MRLINKRRKLVEQEGHRHAVRRGLRGRLHFENMLWLEKVFEFFLTVSFTKPKGERNAFDIKIERVKIIFANLPRAFNNTRILLITDIHIDGIEKLGERIIGIANKLDYDFCILGGDYSFQSNQDCPLAYSRTKELARQLGEKTRVFGVLGNHDKYSMAEVLEQSGVEMLLNENVCLDKNGDKIYLTGLDDCHYYGADDISLADSEIKDKAFKIMVCHSPERYKEIAKAGYSLHLAGHTHGGQVCLPGGQSLVTCATVPRRLVKGKWMYRGMTGYTSRGVGTAGVSVRYCCPPEMTVITLSNGS